MKEQILHNYSLKENEGFTAIKELVERELCDKYLLNDISDLDKVNQEWLNEKNIDLRENHKLMLRVENNLKTILRTLNIKAELIQFPVNVRVLLAERNKQYRELDFNVDTLHCDHWSGAPEDSKNIYLYLRKSEKSPELLHFNYGEEDKQVIENYRGAYKEAPRIRYQVHESRSFAGLMQLFDCTVPHMIRRNSEGCTISIDFRIRNRTSVYDDDLQKNMDDWVKNKMTSLGVYWINSERICSSMKEKIESERKEMESYEWRYKQYREEYINKFYATSRHPDKDRED